MTDDQNQTTPVVDPTSTDQAAVDAPLGTQGEEQKTPTPPPASAVASNASPAESREEKLRRAKIAMEGLDRTIKREASERENEASEEKQQLNKMVLSLSHEKELLELTWVNLDDKRTDLKKILEPILTQEEAIQGEENELESKEEVTLSPSDRREIEQKRWQAQEKRKKIEEEKWLIEEKIQKIETQIGEIKQKYQNLLTQEEEVRNKIQALDEQLILQQEVLKQQHDLAEQRKQQEALKQAEEERKKEEERRKIAEEAERLSAEKAKQEAEKQKQEAVMVEKETNNRLEELRKAEEERLKQEAERQKQEAAKAEDLRRKLAEAMNKASAAASTPTINNAQPVIGSDDLSAQKAVVENNPPVQPQITENIPSKTINLEEPADDLKSIRTFKSDMAEAMKSSQDSKGGAKKTERKIFPWLKF